MHHRSGRRRAAAFLAATLLNGGLVVAAATPAAAATTIRVPFDEPTISAALAVAVDGDTIDVHTGYYPEAPNFQGKDVAVVVNTFGGTSASIDPPGTSHIVIGPGGRLEGFLISDGNAQQGGAIKVNGKGSVIKGNLIVDNDEGGSGSGGAAIYGKSASPVIEANMFVRNACGGDTQPSAGVLTFVGPSAPVIVNNAFIDNTCGAAVSLRSIPSGKQPVITNNTIIGGPTGIQLDGGNADDQVIRNNIIHETTVGIDVDTITPPTVPPTIEHNLMGDNGQDYRGLPDPTGSNGNITGDPLFIHRDGHDVRPQESSPAVDAGTATGAPATDRYGIARPIDGADADLDPEFDIGAHERTGGEPPPPPPPPTSGMLDPAWADDGVSLFPSRYSIALGPTGDGGTFVGSYKVTDGDGPMRVSKFEATGDPASGWGTAGYVIRAFEPGGAGVSFPTHVVPVGLRVTVVGEHYRDTARLGVARLRSDGSYDPAFSSDGRALYKVFPTEHDVVSAFRAEVLTGDKIGIAVVAFDADSHGDLQFTAQAMLKLNANGTQDTTFSGDGVAVIPNSWSDVRWRGERELLRRRPGSHHPPGAQAAPQRSARPFVLRRRHRLGGMRHPPRRQHGDRSERPATAPVREGHLAVDDPRDVPVHHDGRVRHDVLG